MFDQIFNMKPMLGRDHFIIWGDGKLFFRFFFSVDVKAGFFFHVPFEGRSLFFFTKN